MATVKQLTARVEELESLVHNYLAEQAAPTPKKRKPTPFELLGYKPDDVFRTGDDEGAFKKGSLVKLHSDDSSHCPKFKLLAGDCEHSLAGGDPGAFEDLDNLTLLRPVSG